MIRFILSPLGGGEEIGNKNRLTAYKKNDILKKSVLSRTKFL